MLRSRLIHTVEDGTDLTVGANIAQEHVTDPLKQSIVFMEISTDDGAQVVGLTRDEALDLMDSILVILDDYGVGPLDA